LKDYQTVLELCAVKDAAFAIDKNGMGTVFIIDHDEIVLGVVTDGDIRRYLISGGLYEDCIRKCINTQFSYEHVSASRETILKSLDDRVRYLPILNDLGKIVKIVSRKSYPIISDNLKCVRARAPCRISFAGGGTDLSSHFLGDGTSLVLNVTVQKYCRATMTVRSDQLVRLTSLDIGKTMEFQLSEVDNLRKTDFDLFISIISIVRPVVGFDIQIESDVAIGTGLGGSSAATAAFLGCLNEIRSIKWTSYELAEICYQSERHYADIPGGWQDQYACVFGGINLMTFSRDKHVVTPLKISDDVFDELEDSLILYDTRKQRNSGKIHRANFGKNSKKKELALIEAVELADAMKECILLGKLSELGRLLDRAWLAKKKQDSNISNPYLDDIYSGAKEHGAVGGKLLGAGAGGFFLFMAAPKNVPGLRSHLDSIGGRSERILLDKYGLKTWVVKNEI